MAVVLTLCLTVFQVYNFLPWPLHGFFFFHGLLDFLMRIQFNYCDVCKYQYLHLAKEIKTLMSAPNYQE